MKITFKQEGRENLIKARQYTKLWQAASAELPKENKIKKRFRFIPLHFQSGLQEQHLHNVLKTFLFLQNQSPV